MFLHVSVILSIGGGGSASRGSLNPGGGVCIQGVLGRIARILRDTVNEQAVRILLECILVLGKISEI